MTTQNENIKKDYLVIITSCQSDPSLPSYISPVYKKRKTLANGKVIITLICGGDYA
jgi:hypothetical protein